MVSEWTALPGGGAKTVKRFERSKGPNIALYKNHINLFFTMIVPQVAAVKATEMLTCGCRRQ